MIEKKALRKILSKFLVHYHEERNHQGVGNRLLFPGQELSDYGPIATRERLGGKLKYFYRKVD